LSRDMRNGLGAMYLFAGQKAQVVRNKDEARRNYLRAKEEFALALKDGECVPARHNMGAALFCLEDYDGAFTQLQDAFKAAPDLELAASYYYLGCICSRRGDYAAAREKFGKALKANPKSNLVEEIKQELGAIEQTGN
jgi:tetratricopeptide (TPR) repeat protein